LSEENTSCFCELMMASFHKELGWVSFVDWLNPKDPAVFVFNIRKI